MFVFSLTFALILKSRNLSFQKRKKKLEYLTVCAYSIIPSCKQPPAKNRKNTSSIFKHFLVFFIPAVSCRLLFFAAAVVNNSTFRTTCYSQLNFGPNSASFNARQRRQPLLAINQQSSFQSKSPNKLLMFWPFSSYLLFLHLSIFNFSTISSSFQLGQCLTLTSIL